MYLESIIGNVSINELIFDLSVLPSTSTTTTTPSSSTKTLNATSPLLPLMLMATILCAYTSSQIHPIHVSQASNLPHPDAPSSHKTANATAGYPPSLTNPTSTSSTTNQPHQSPQSGILPWTPQPSSPRQSSWPHSLLSNSTILT